MKAAIENLKELRQLSFRVGTVQQYEVGRVPVERAGEWFQKLYDTARAQPLEMLRFIRTGYRMASGLCRFCEGSGHPERHVTGCIVLRIEALLAEAPAPERTVPAHCVMCGGRGRFCDGIVEATCSHCEGTGGRPSPVPERPAIVPERADDAGAMARGLLAEQRRCGLDEPERTEPNSSDLYNRLMSLDARNDWPILRDLILKAEDAQFTPRESARLAPRLLDLAIQYRDSKDPRDAAAVFSAIRTGASMFRPNEAAPLLPLFEPGHPIETSRVALKMLGRIFEAAKGKSTEPPDEWTTTRKDLALLVHQLAAECSDPHLRMRALDYLERKGLTGSPLREPERPELTPEIVRDALLLVERVIPLKVIAKWTDEQQREAGEWAARVADSASDNEDVVVPPEPEWTKRYEVDFQGRYVSERDAETPPAATGDRA